MAPRVASPPWRIEPLGNHDRAAFSCEEEPLTLYLQKMATQDIRRYAAAVFVAISSNSPQVLGYYTLSALSIALEAIPTEQAKMFARYPAVPVTLLGRLARDIRQKGTGLGEFLLMDALHRACHQSKSIASSAVIVDAKSDHAARFYQDYGFLRLPDSPNRLFLPMKTIEGLL